MATARERSGSADSAPAAQQQSSREKTKNSNQGILQQQVTASSDVESQVTPSTEHDVFGSEEGAETAYKTCDWWYVPKLTITLSLQCNFNTQLSLDNAPVCFNSL